MSTLKDRVRQTLLVQEAPLSEDPEHTEGAVIADFRILGLAPTASVTEIDARYRELAKRVHPDAHPGTDDSQLRRVNQAYSRLKTLARAIADTRSV
jgi:DnaJ-class molecular chaperone